MPKDNPNLRIHGSLPPRQHMLLHPEEFNPDKLTVNGIEPLDDLVIARILGFSERIIQRKKLIVTITSN